MNALRIVFAGSPAAAVPSLRMLDESRHEVAAVITRADSAQGRKAVSAPTPVAHYASESGIESIRQNRLGEEVTERVRALAPDLGVIVAYGALVREPLLSTPRLGWINLHFSLLPRWRGAAPVQHAIMAGDSTTGAAVFQLVRELDAGDVYAHIAQPIGAQQTAGALLDTLATDGAQLLLRVVESLADGSARSRPQQGEVTFAPKLSLSDGEVQWRHPAARVFAQIRGVTHEPGAFSILDGARLKILEAAIAREAPRIPPGEFRYLSKAVLVGTSTDPIELLSVHPAGKRAMNAADWWRGRPSGSAMVAE
ncbi:MAG: methionyl-tRNA formyltransferase [Salinibacterium sp.]|nr:methionyl-tRNA formyltransferase [Salinibacterium sp.]